MNKHQRVIVVLLVLAILLSAASVIISFNVFNGYDAPRQIDGVSDGGNSGEVQLVVEGNGDGGAS